MNVLPLIAAVLAVAGCASQSVTPVSGGVRPLMERSDRPVLLFVKSPAPAALPQQIIGDERPNLVLDGLS